jgi:K+-sensing histidine kinase KdpD
VRVTVRHAGLGIDPESVQKLFQALHDQERRDGDRLSVSRSIVERHHGRLWAEPNDRPGATFAFAIACNPGR